MSLLQVIQDACDEIGVNKPSAVVGSSDVTAIQMLAIAKTSLRAIAREADFIYATEQYEFVAFAGASVGDYVLPSDWDRFISDTFWDSTNDRPVLGPATPQEWQTLIRGNLGGTGIDTWFRLIGPTTSANVVRLWPVRTSGSIAMSFDYISTDMAKTSAGVSKTTFTADGDVPKCEEQLLKLDIIWRFKKAKGTAYAEEKLDFDNYLSSAMARNGGARKLNMGGRPLSSILAVNIQDSNFPS